MLITLQIDPIKGLTQKLDYKIENGFTYAKGWLRISQRTQAKTRFGKRKSFLSKGNSMAMGRGFWEYQNDGHTPITLPL